MKKFLKNNRSGFTLIELLVVIAILAVLATLYVPRILSSSNNAKETVEKANARTLASEITMYNASNTTKFLGNTAVDATSCPSFTDANKTKYSSYKKVEGDDFTDNATPAGIKALLDGRTFPDDTVVILLIDPTGNCFIVSATGAPLT